MDLNKFYKADKVSLVLGSSLILVNNPATTKNVAHLRSGLKATSTLSLMPIFKHTL